MAWLLSINPQLQMVIIVADDRQDRQSAWDVSMMQSGLHETAEGDFPAPGGKADIYEN